MPTNIVLIVGAALLACFIFHPRLMRSRAWRATVTPLASIIGSGFLVAGPILTSSAGKRAWLAMTGLCAIGYVYGEAIRHNIVHIEPRLGRLPPGAAVIERASDFLLSLAYFVSVAYYLNLFAAFGLRLVDIRDPFHIRLAASSAIAFVGVVGMTGGLRAMERLEIGAVGLKLSVIGGLLAALAVIATLAGPAPPFELAHPAGIGELRILLGLVILVQGFETSRYLGAAYDPALRVRTMRAAQLIATAIYVGFVFLVTPFFREGLPHVGAETAIIDVLRPIGAAAAPLIILAALASQSSAAVADTNGASGLLAEVTHGRTPVRLGALVTAAVAIAITWSANIFEIVTYASKAFVAYYALQSIQALRSALHQRRYVSAGMFALGVALAIAVIVFAAPVAA